MPFQPMKGLFVMLAYFWMVGGNLYLILTHTEFLVFFLKHTMDKMKGPVARILTWPWLASSLNMCGPCIVIDSL